MDGLGVVRSGAVVFVRDARMQKKILVFRNDGSKALTFKLKSSIRGMLRVLPVYGRVAAGAAVIILLEFQWNRNTPERFAADSTRQRISVAVELRWNERRSEADCATKRIPGESTVERALL